jgi:hypothetical protein
MLALSSCTRSAVESQRTLIERAAGAGMLLLIYYVVAITILVLHFTGWLRYHNMEWLVLVLAATVFPAVLYL